MERRLPWKRNQSSKPKLPRTPWLFKLPKVFQINSSLTFLALFLGLAGVAAFFGLSEPTAITSHMSIVWYKLWGFGLAAGGLSLLTGIVRRDRLIEKYSARILEIQLGVFGAWSIAAVGIGRATVSLAMMSIVLFFLEQRICFINIILNAQEEIRRERGRKEVSDD